MFKKVQSWFQRGALKLAKTAKRWIEGGFGLHRLGDPDFVIVLFLSDFPLLAVFEKELADASDNAAFQEVLSLNHLKLADVAVLLANNWGFGWKP